ncbi:hypothetical protein K3M35_05130 [Rhodococcus sp. DMU2021]|uniref:hypothetical protein n=1 Tax=Rhodococcus sp. DMU2021 TaxID=2866997 RepID=UPI001C7E031C|nr:hypothetical protein [Rhodococcus sp. DMU2021]MBX4168049.1 hypothetical protein [Rhodococcus sp. DMU2021]
MSHIVTAPLVGVNGADGKLKYLYHGTVVPSDVSKEDIDRLVEDGLIKSTEEAPRASSRKTAGSKSDGTAADSGRSE